MKQLTLRVPCRTHTELARYEMTERKSRQTTAHLRNRMPPPSPGGGQPRTTNHPLPPSRTHGSQRPRGGRRDSRRSACTQGGCAPLCAWDFWRFGESHARKVRFRSAAATAGTGDGRHVVETKRWNLSGCGGPANSHTVQDASGSAEPVGVTLAEEVEKLAPSIVAPGNR